MLGYSVIKIHVDVCRWSGKFSPSFCIFFHWLLELECIPQFVMSKYNKLIFECSIVTEITKWDSFTRNDSVNGFQDSKVLTSQPDEAFRPQTPLCGARVSFRRPFTPSSLFAHSATNGLGGAPKLTVSPCAGNPRYVTTCVSPYYNVRFTYFFQHKDSPGIWVENNATCSTDLFFPVWGV